MTWLILPLFLVPFTAAYTWAIRIGRREEREFLRWGEYVLGPDAAFDAQEAAERECWEAMPSLIEPQGAA